jgi:thiamine-phosphate pyrophosphorylase
MNLRWPCRGLYAITTDEPDTRQLLRRVESVLDAGACLLQYRNKLADTALRHEQASALLTLCRSHAVALIINDDWRLAAAVGAEGAHLGEDDGEIVAARAVLGPDAIIGASCYDELSRAQAAVAAGASYVAFGAFFPSSTKPAARRAPVGLLRDAAMLGVPRVAIGGITPENAHVLVEAGADLLAVIGGVFEVADPAAAVRAFRRHFEKNTPSLPFPARGGGNHEAEAP